MKPHLPRWLLIFGPLVGVAPHFVSGPYQCTNQLHVYHASSHMSITNPYVDRKWPFLRGGKIQMPSIVTHHQSKPGEALHGQGATYPVPTLPGPPSRWWSLIWNPTNNLPRANVAIRWRPGSGKKGRKRNWERFSNACIQEQTLFSETNLWKRPIYLPFFEKLHMYLPDFGVITWHPWNLKNCIHPAPVLIRENKKHVVCSSYDKMDNFRVTPKPFILFGRYPQIIINSGVCLEPIPPPKQKLTIIPKYLGRASRRRWQANMEIG